MKKILITGSSGLLGSNFYYMKDFFSEISNSEYKIDFTSRTKFKEDIFVLDPLKISESEIKDNKYDLIIHCGSATHVDLCEQDTRFSYDSIVQSTNNLLRHFEGTPFYYISTDYVFEGLNGPSTESELAVPINNYGLHKHISENLVLSFNKKNKIFRLANLYGIEYFRTQPKNFVFRTMIEMINGKTDFVASKVHYTSPTLASDVVKAIITVLYNENDKSNIYHLASDDYMTKVESIYKIAESLNKEITVKELTEDEIDSSYAKRPLKGGLSAQKFLNAYPSFKFTYLDEFLEINKINTIL